MALIDTLIDIKYRPKINKKIRTIIHREIANKLTEHLHSLDGFDKLSSDNRVRLEDIARSIISTGLKTFR